MLVPEGITAEVISVDKVNKSLYGLKQFESAGCWFKCRGRVLNCGPVICYMNDVLLCMIN